MSQIKYATPLLIELLPSRWLFVVLSFMHAGAMLVLLPLPWPWWSQTVLCGIIAISLWHQLRTHALLIAPQAVVTLLWDADDEWTLHLQNKQTLSGELAHSTFIHPWLTVLNFKNPGKWRQRSVIILPDNIHPDVFRQLRVRLQLRRKNSQA